MTDRWNPKWVTRPVVRDPKFFVPDGAAAPPPAVEPRGRTWGIRRRGDTDGQVQHAYRCPVHGVFEVMVPRSEVPDEMPCPRTELQQVALLDPQHWQPCATASPWAGSSCGIGHAAGEVAS